MNGNPNRVVVTLLVLSLGMSACNSTSSGSDPAPGATAGDSPLELVVSEEPLAPGTYTNSDFTPRVTFTLSGDWYAVEEAPGFFDVQQDVGSPHVIAVQFANVEGVYGSDGRAAPPTTAAEASRLIESNPDLLALGGSGALMDGREGFVVEVENAGQDPTRVLDSAAGALSIDEGRRLWIAFFDVGGGVLAVLVGGSAERWEETLLTAEPVLESVTIDG